MDNQKKPYEMINDIVKEFDYVKVHNVMVFLDWKWAALHFLYEDHDGSMIPTLEMLRKHSIQKMFDVVEKLEQNPEPTKEYITGSGGLRVSAYKENNLITYINLEFILTNWSAFIDDK